MVVHQCSGSSAEFTAGPALLEASWVWPSTKHGSMKAACDLRPAGPWNATEQDMPPPILSASHAIQASSAGRLRVFLDKLSAPEDCCTNVIVVGGSVPCGHGFPGCGGSKVMFANTTAAGGLPGAWPTWLKRWLDWSRPKCCPSGHVVTNLCVGATGIDYVLATLRTRVLPRLATSAAHLVLVDTAVNDYNEYFYVKRCQWRRCISQEEIKRKWQLTQVMAEALIRQLLLLNVSVAFVENARFRGGDTPNGYGAWAAHEPVLRHYGVPTVHLGFAAEAAARASLPRPELWAREWTHVDGQHLSAPGHWITAMLFVYGVVCNEWHRIRDDASRRQPVTQAPLPMPLVSEGQLEPYIGMLSVPNVIIDFTSKEISWRDAVVQPAADGARSAQDLESGWVWTRAVRKAAGGGYALLPADPTAAAAAQSTDELGKLSFSVRSAKPCSFDVKASFRTGRLRVGYLRSYEGQASVAMQVFVAVAGGLNATGIPAAEWVINGTWEERVSIYTSDDFELSESVQRHIWPARCGYFRSGRCQRMANVSVGDRWAVPALVRFTSIPMHLPHLGPEGAWAPFSLYTVASY